MKSLLLFAFIFNLGMVSAHAQSSCHQIAALDAPIISIDNGNRETGELIKVTLTDPNAPRFYAEGRVKVRKNLRVLTLALLMKDADGNRSQILRGKESLRRILEIISQKGIEIDAFSAMWNDHFLDYDGPSDNFMAFVKGYHQSIMKTSKSLRLPENIDHYLPAALEETLVQAAEKGAWSTWTGQQMKSLGFKYIQEVQIFESVGYPGADGSMGSIDVRVLWTKNKLTDDMHLNARRDKDLRSSMPRFHMMVHNLSKFFGRIEK